MQLKGKNILVTGASGGIGRAIALAFAERQVNVIITYRSDEKKAIETVEKLRGYDVEADKFQVELSEENQVKKLFDFVKEKFGSLDILVNNAGSADPKSLSDTTKQDWYDAFDDNLISAVLCTKSAVEMMEKNKEEVKGKIVNISSINGLENCGRPGNIIYSAAKGALSNFTKTLAKGIGPEILINALAPGPVWTEIWEGASEEKKKAMEDMTYIKRWMKPEEIADACVFLAENDAMTGEIMVVDGGFNLKDYL